MSGITDNGVAATANRRVRNERMLNLRITAAWVFAICSLTIILCLPFLTTMLGEEDGIWLGAVAWLRSGRVIYRDFFEFLPPLSFLLTEAWLNVVGVSIAGARFLAILAIAGTAGFTFLACRFATGRAAASAALAIGWVLASQGLWTQVNHHWFTLFFSMTAAWAALSAVHSGARGRWRLLLAGLTGLAGGAAAMVTPTQGALVILASAVVFLDLRRLRLEALAFLAGVTVVPLCMLAYVAAHGVAADAFADVILFTMQQYSTIQHVPYANVTTVQTIPSALIYPVCALTLAALAIRDGRSLLRDKLLVTCAVFGLAGFVGSYPRPDSAHLNFTLPLALPLLGRCAVVLTQEWPAIGRRVALVSSACLFLPSMLHLALISQNTFYMPTVETSAGPVKFWDQNGRAEAIARIATLPATDKIFFYPYDPLLPVLTGREQVSKYDMFLPSYTLVSQYEDACASVMRGADWVLLDRRIMATEHLLLDYPSMPDPSPRERTRFEQALEAGFTMAFQDGSYELRRRTPAAQVNLCEGGWKH